MIVRRYIAFNALHLRQLSVAQRTDSFIFIYTCIATKLKTFSSANKRFIIDAYKPVCVVLAADDQR